MGSKVYFSQVKDASDLEAVSEKVKKVFSESHLLDLVQEGDFVGVKLHFGEEDNVGFIKPGWVRTVIDETKKKSENIFVSDTNTLYRGKRFNSVDHLKIAYLHGFDFATLGAPVIIADGLIGESYEEFEIKGRHFRSVNIASAFTNADAILSLAHLTGHMLTGIGGALKNLGMGCASRSGKLQQHSTVSPEVNPEKCNGCSLCLKRCPAGAITLADGKAQISKKDCIGCGECIAVCRSDAINVRWNESTRNLQEKMVEYAYGAIKAIDGKVGFMNFLIKVTRDCDCMAKDDPRIVPDIGILASKDPVAIDKASCDLVNEAGGRDVFRAGYPEIDWQVQLNYAAGLGMGSLEYDLEEI